MAKARDKKLMLDMMKYPSTVHFRDDYITVLVPADATALNGLADFHAPQDDRVEGYYVIRTYDGNTIVLYEGFKMRILFDTMSKSRDGSDFDVLTKKFPSLYKAFGEWATKKHFLPLIENQRDADIHAALNDDVADIRHVKNLTHKRKRHILTEFPNAFQHMEQTTELAKFLLNHTEGGSLRNITEGLRSNAICNLAIRKNPSDIRDVKCPTEKQKLTVVHKDGRMLRYIENPSLMVMIAAVNSHPDAWEYIRDDKVRRRIKKVRHMRKFQ